jgi:hypothetical protein
MRYMLLIYQAGERHPLHSEASQQVREAHRKFRQECIDAGAFVAADPLHAPSTATTVRIRDGERLLSDGPFAETREWLAGYYLLDCPDLDAALELAARCPGCAQGDGGAVEVRPVLEVSPEG